MIERLITVRNVGLLAEVTAPVDLGAVTLIYGENGRGKSTLAWLFRVASLADPAQMSAKATFGASGPQDVGFLYADSGGKKQCHYKNGAWSCKLPNIEVFDSLFVDDNVYSGMSVESKQRQQLLDFVLGDAQVEIKRRIDNLDVESRQAAQQRRSAEDALRGYAGPMTVDKYVRSASPPDIDAQIDRAARQLQDVKDANDLIVRAQPKSVKQLDFLSSELRELATTTLADLDSAAEERVRQHIMGRAPGMEPWLKTGLDFCDDETCPFCGQSLDAESVVAAYKSFFNDEYRGLRTRLEDLAKRVRSRLEPERLERLSELAAENNRHLANWAPQVTLPPIEFPEQGVQQSLHELGRIAELILQQKLNSPLEPVSRSLCDDYERAVGAVNRSLDDYRAEVGKSIERIQAFLENVQAGDAVKLEREHARLRALKQRGLAHVQQLAEQYSTARAEHSRINKEKDLLKSKLRDAAPQVIQPYATSINSLLSDFGADFHLHGVHHSNPGGRPTVEYKLKVRGAEVGLGSKEFARTAPCFGSALSDGDKRTLALCFFLAKVGADPRLAEKVLVIDDPMSSLDRNRQRKTIESLVNLAQKARQVIVLSHDARFLAALKRRVLQKAPRGTAVNIIELQIERCPTGSTVASCDIERRALQGFPDKRARLQDFIDGRCTNTEQAARLVREVLEGYLKLKYPSDIATDDTLGEIINNHANYSAQPRDNISAHLPALKELNETKVFHHGGNLDEELGLSDAEVRGWAQKVIDLIYGGV